MTYLDEPMTIGSASGRPSVAVVDLDVVIPVRNEENSLVRAVETVAAHLDTLPYSARITIADNASTDDTAMLGRLLADRIEGVRFRRLDQPGRGRALKDAWGASDAAVVVYMDVDLSTDLAALLPLVAPLLSGHSDIAIGTRLDPASRTVRGTKREVISRCYNLLLRTTLGARFSDAQCGFKAMRAEVARALLPLVEDDSWFFDTEMLLVAERSGLRIHEVPVDWVDDPDSRVDVVGTATDDLRGMWRVGRALAHGTVPVDDVRRALGRAAPATTTDGWSAQAVIFAIIGVASTIAYALLFLLLSGSLGSQAANALALVVTAVGNTAANRRFTFGITDPNGRGRHHARGLIIFAAGLAATSGALLALHAAIGTGHTGAEIATLTIANLAVTVGRFLAMRWWVFRTAP